MGKLLGSLAVLLVAALLAVFFLLENPDRFKSQISNSISQSTGYDVAINGSLSWRYWPPIAIEVTDLTLSNLTLSEKGQQIATIEVLEADVDLMPLLTGQSLLRVNQVLLKGGQVDLQVDSGGTGNWQLPESDTSQSAQGRQGATDSDTITTVDTLALESLVVSYHDAGTGDEYRADVRRIQVSGYAPGATVDLLFDLAAEDLKNEQQITASGRGQLQNQPSEDRLTFNDLEIQGQVDQATSQMPYQLMLSGYLDSNAGVLRLYQYQADINGIRANGDATVETVPALQVSAFLHLAQTPSETLKDTLGIDLPIHHILLETRLRGNAERLEVYELNGRFDQTGFTGSAEVSATRQALLRSELRLDRINLDQYLDTGDAAASQAPAPADTEIIPLALLRENTLNAILRIDEALYQGDSFRNIKVEVANDQKQFRFTANANAWQGKLVANADTDLRRAMTNFKLTLDQLDIPAMTTVQGLTGRLVATSNLNFAGAKLSELEETLRGRSVFNVTDGTLDVTPIKAMTGMIDTLRGKQSSISAWPDTLPFDQLVGEHVIESGLQRGQLLTADLQNLKFTAIGGINLQQQTLNFDVAAQFRKAASENDFVISDQLVGVRWPLRCAGGFTDTPASLCLGREGAIKTLVADILKQDLQRRGDDKLNELIGDKVPEQYRDLTRELIKGLFKKD